MTLLTACASYPKNERSFILSYKESFLYVYLELLIEYKELNTLD